MLPDRQFFDIFRCPVGKGSLHLKAKDELRPLNEAIARGRAWFQDGTRVAEPVEAGLATADGASFYAIRDGVPGLLPSQRITVGEAAPAAAGMGWDFAQYEHLEQVWERLAAEWKHRGAPARPAPEDTALLEQLVGRTLAGRERTRALLLGVTPEIATMRWPAGTELLALDVSTAMIREVWPARQVPEAVVARGDWAAIPVRDAVFDIVVGDASLGIQPYPDGFFRVVGELRRVLRDGGVLATRVYTRTEDLEPVDAIFADLRAGRIRSFDVFRFRLLIALHGDRPHGSRGRDVWEAWKANVPDPAALVESLGWPQETIQAMEKSQYSTHAVIFPTLREIREDFSRSFEEIACEYRACEDGGRFPTLAFRARRS